MVAQLRSLFLSVILLSSLIGCATIQEIQEPITESKNLVKKLDDLNPPERKVTIAVYSFVDKTGQRKPSENVALLSSAVTQGAEIWLIQALKKAGKGEWFQVVERVGLDNLLKERQIIRQTREQFEGKNAKQVKPLLFAGVLLEGGIVGYDTNIETGGSGARYLGVGISSEYRRDMVTVGIRLISVSTGEVLLAVSSSKTILSTRVAGNVFKFFDMGTKLLEAESGITENESVSYAVRKAIEQSVYEIIKQGEKQNLWKTKEKK